jgi:hypothetical protein
MARVLIDHSYQLVLSPTEAGVLLSLLHEATIDETVGEHTVEEFREFEDALIGIHSVLQDAGVEHADLTFNLAD